MKPDRLSRTLMICTLVAFTGTLVPHTGHAGIIGTVASLQADAGAAREANLAKVDATLARADVQRELNARGVTPEEARARVAALTDSEIAGLAGRIDQAPAGSDAGLFALIGVVFIVLLILDYVGAIHIFNHR